MYAMYEKKTEGNLSSYKFIKQVSLFGCKSGYIPYLLKNQLVQDSSEPFKWHINIENALNSVGLYAKTLIINLKPYSGEPNLSLYELSDVWGNSSSGWTPIMLYLKGLFIDENPLNFEQKNFTRSLSKIEDPIFSMLYLGFLWH